MRDYEVCLKTMAFWNRIKDEVNGADEYKRLFQELSLKIIAMARDIDMLSNRLEVLDSIVKSNRARIGKLKIEEIEGNTEKSKNFEKVYL